MELEKIGENIIAKTKRNDFSKLKCIKNKHMNDVK